MGLLQGIGSIPGLHYVFEAATGSPSPYRVEQIKRDTAAGVSRAMGPNATPVQKAEAAENATREIDGFLKKTGQHPDDASVFNSPGFEGLRKNLSIVIFVVSAIAVLYFAVQLGPLLGIFKRR